MVYVVVVGICMVLLGCNHLSVLGSLLCCMGFVVGIDKVVSDNEVVV